MTSLSSSAASNRQLSQALDYLRSQLGDGLPPSYRGATAWTYDCALAALALHAAGDPAAQRVIQALASVQEPDGRLRTAYDARSLEVAGPDTATGNQAWAGIAFARLGLTDHALAAARWIERTQSTDRGFTGGIVDDRRLAWKSTEHNADSLALFRLLGIENSCEAFLDSMFTGASLFTGTTDDGVTPNRSPIPLDAQVWPALATGRYGAAVEWALANLAVDGGVSFSDADTSAVWFEGTAQLALFEPSLLDRVWAAQLPDGSIPVASRAGLRSGFGEKLGTRPHIGTTAWAVVAALGFNPLAG